MKGTGKQLPKPKRGFWLAVLFCVVLSDVILAGKGLMLGSEDYWTFNMLPLDSFFAEFGLTAVSPYLIVFAFFALLMVIQVKSVEPKERTGVVLGFLKKKRSICHILSARSVRNRQPPVDLFQSGTVRFFRTGPVDLRDLLHNSEILPVRQK